MWSRIPLVRLIIPVIIGILITEYLFVPRWSMTVLYIAGLAVMAGTLFYSLAFGYRFRWVFGLMILLFFCGYACLLTSSYTAEEERSYREVSDSSCTYIGVIEEAFQLRERSCKGKIRLIGCKEEGEVVSMQGIVMIYTSPDSLLALARHGSFILIRASLKPLRPPANPGEFNYKEYLRKQGIYHSAYLKEGEWQLGEERSTISLYTLAIEMRKGLLQKLQDNGVTDDHFGISSALLLGDDSHLDDQLRNMYARAGAMHILCVSGLHVGVIFLVLNTVFGFLRLMAGGRIILPVVLIACIWMYALITGLAPPVMRASIMISFIIIGNALQRQKNIYNTLAASAMLMLLLEPYVLFSAGFQLSYTAVIGIVFLQKPIYNLAYLKYKLPDKLWAITAVSIAAQLGTMPVVLYYFHQFPVYSLITNLFVIPLSSMIIYTGLFLFIAPSVTQLSLVAAWILDVFIMLMDKGIQAVEKLPGALISNISFDLPILASTYIIIISLSLFLVYRYKFMFVLCLCVILMASSYRLYQKHRQLNQLEFVIYSVSGHSAYDFVRGKKHTLYCDSALIQDQSKIAYSMAPHWLDRGLDHPDTVILSIVADQDRSYGRPSLLDVPGKRIIIWEGRFPSCRPPSRKLKVDLLILRGKGLFNPEEALQWFEPGWVILDSSVPPWIKLQEGDERFWNVKEKGAFIAS